MTNLKERTMTDTSTRSNRKRRYIMSMGITFIGAVIGCVLLQLGMNQNNDAMKIVSLTIIGTALLWGMWLYHGSADEHEKEALYFSNSIAFYTLIIVGFCSIVLRTLTTPVMISIQNMLLASALTGCVAWIWKKYR